jgi:iron complex outermembrane receptor protein
MSQRASRRVRRAGEGSCRESSRQPPLRHDESFADWIRRCRAAAVAACVAGVLAAPAGATRQEAAATGVSDLKRLDVEDLLQVEVTSASKRPQALADIPAAVSVLTASDIRRGGARTLADALRLAGGLHVARFDSRTWAITGRGMSSQVANKLLVLIDGRTVYTPLFSGVFWDVQAPLLEDIERIEVVRGPGATLWGANAVNGVINVITQHAADAQGGLVTAGAGNELAFGGVRWGGPLGPGHYRLSVKYDALDALALPDGRDAEDPLRLGRASFRADLPTAGDGDLTFLAAVYAGEIGHRSLADSDVDGGSVQARWARPLAGGSHLEVRAFYDHTFRRVPAQFQEERDTADLEVEHRWQAGRHDLLWGGGYRRSADHVPSSAVFGWDPEREEVWIASLFVQDEVRLGSRWRLNAGLRAEEQSTMDLELLPGLNLAYELTPDQLLWAGAARAVRAPTRIDRDVRVPGQPPFVVRGSRDFVPEELVAYELGWRTALPLDGSLELVLFHNDYDDLRTQEPSPTGLPLVLSNRLRARTEGGSIAARAVPTAWLELEGNITFLSTELRPDADSRDPSRGTAEANDPDRYGFLRADLALRPDLELSASLRHVGELHAPRVPAYTELDLRLAWSPRPALELALVGQNLLDEQHPELGAPAAREEVERGVYAQLTWRF